VPKHYESFQLPAPAKSDDFFIAVAKGENVHSFVMLGVMVDDKPVFLARVGKVGVPPHAQLQRESYYPYGKLSYQAYTITYQHYLDFIELMKKSDDAKELAYYQSQDRTAFEYQWVSSPSNNNNSEQQPRTVEEQRILSRSKTLYPFNTCRHTAIDLTAHVVNDKATTDRISRLYFVNLPVMAHFVHGQTDDYFYTFPLPPSGFCEVDDN
jgi:hypothetical protein